jgi:hypothetical protein
MSFVDRLQPYVAEWASAAHKQNVVTKHHLHDTAAIPEHFWPGPTRPAGPARARPAPGPPTDLTGRAWAEILKLAKFFLAQARPEMLFLVTLHYKMRGRPAQAWARARPEN